MKQILLVVHVIIALFVIGLILLQNSKGGLGSGSGGEQYRSRRGAERVVFTATIIGAILFLLTSIASILVR